MLDKYPCARSNHRDDTYSDGNAHSSAYSDSNEYSYKHTDAHGDGHSSSDSHAAVRGVQYAQRGVGRRERPVHRVPVSYGDTDATPYADRNSCSHAYTHSHG